MNGYAEKPKSNKGQQKEQKGQDANEEEKSRTKRSQDTLNGVRFRLNM